MNCPIYKNSSIFVAIIKIRYLKDLLKECFNRFNDTKVIPEISNHCLLPLGQLTCVYGKVCCLGWFLSESSGNFVSVMSVKTSLFCQWESRSFVYVATLFYWVFFGKQFCLNGCLGLQLGGCCRITCTELVFFVWSRCCTAVWKFHWILLPAVFVWATLCNTIIFCMFLPHFKIWVIALL